MADRISLIGSEREFILVSSSGVSYTVTMCRVAAVNILCLTVCIAVATAQPTLTDPGLQVETFVSGLAQEVPPKVFLYYTEVADPNGDGLPDSGTALGNRVYRYTWNASANGGQGRLEDPQLILDLPWSPGPNHDGGILALGPASSPSHRAVSSEMVR